MTTFRFFSSPAAMMAMYESAFTVVVHGLHLFVCPDGIPDDVHWQGEAIYREATGGGMTEVQTLE
jgi:hypothetical protein